MDEFGNYYDQFNKPIVSGTTPAPGAGAGERSLFDKTVDYLSGAPELVKDAGPGQKIFADAAQEAKSNLLKGIDPSKLTATDMLNINAAAAAAGEKALAAAQPGFLSKNRGLLIGGGAALAAATPYLMETPEMEKPDVLSDAQRAAMREGPPEELINQYRLGTEALFPGVTPAAERDTLVAPTASSFGFSESLRRRFPELFAADGGGVFPRRTGGIMPDEGVPGKDSVKAMVMPGEFIFTTKAVKGAGNGDLRRGINNMYSVMRNLEARGERMA
jgi:hypothetical protein